MQVQEEFYRGVVINNDDEYRRGRVQVRIDGLHNGYQDSNIKWAEVIQPTFMGILGGTGACSVLQIGTAVWIKFDKDFDHPIVVGVLVGGTEEHNELYDTPLPIENREGADWGTEAIPKNCDFRYGRLLKARHHINTVHKGKYLTTTTLETPGGHLIELDDTPSTPAIRITHSSGLSQITLNEDGSISIIGHTVNVTAAQNMAFESIGDISINAKKNIHMKSGNMTSIKAGSDVMVETDTSLLANVGKNFHIDSKGAGSINTKDALAIKSNNDSIALDAKVKVGINGEKETVMQGGSGSVNLNTSTLISSTGGKVGVFGNTCSIDTKLDVAEGVSTNGMVTGSFMLAKDFLPSMFPSMPSMRLTESYNKEFSNEVDILNNEIQKARDLEDTDEKIKAINNINIKIKNINNSWSDKKEILHKAMLDDFISQHIEHFGDIDPSEIQMLNESIEGRLNTSGIKITNRTPDGSKKLVEKNNCTCDWLDPSSWFEIDGIDPFNAERFKNILNYNITWPDLRSLFPPVPQFSLMAVIKIVMKIVAKKVIKLLSAFKKMVMQYIRPVIDAINNIMAIINAIPPKLDFNLDLASMLGSPLFSLPSLPDTSMPNICCSVNECTCSDCASKVNSWQNTAEKWVEENVPDKPLIPDMSKSEFISNLPSGGRKQGSLI